MGAQEGSRGWRDGVVKFSQGFLQKEIAFTLWKLNIAPENIASRKESSLPTIIFQGELLNFGRVGSFSVKILLK